MKPALAVRSTVRWLTLAGLCLMAGGVCLQAANVDIVHLRATVLMQTNETITSSGTIYRTAKVKMATKDVLKLAADALGYADITFGTGKPVRLGIASGLVNAVDGSFLILDSTGTNIVLNLDLALANIGGYFHTEIRLGVSSGFDGGIPQHYLHTNFGEVVFHDGIHLRDGRVHSFKFSGLETSKHSVSSRWTYRESFVITGVGDAWDGEFENLVGVITSAKVYGAGKGPIEP